MLSMRRCDSNDMDRRTLNLLNRSTIHSATICGHVGNSRAFSKIAQPVVGRCANVVAIGIHQWALNIRIPQVAVDVPRNTTKVAVDYLDFKSGPTQTS